MIALWLDGIWALSRTAHDSSWPRDGVVKVRLITDLLFPLLWSPCSYGRTTGLYIEPLGETYHSHGSSTHLPVVDGFALWSERVYNPPLSHSFIASINVIIFHHNKNTYLGQFEFQYCQNQPFPFLRIPPEGMVATGKNILYH